LQQIQSARKEDRKTERRIGNTRILNKIEAAQPVVGNSELWEEHFRSNQKLKCNISRAKHRFFDVESSVT
jgi:hypothetical protein